jgi:N-acetylglutamate synthase-like GNAT family acetyltransferase
MPADLVSISRVFVCLVFRQLLYFRVGQQLLSQAIEFCRSRHFKSVFLWTVSELKVAGHLYRQAGFVLTEQLTHDIWGSIRTEERYDLIL